MALFLSGNIHKGNELFSADSRGKQCAFISLSALLTAQNIPLTQWSKTTINNILLQGDQMYLKALKNGFINLNPGVEYLSVDNLPKFVHVTYCRNTFSYQICRPVIDTTNLSPAQGKITSPITTNSDHLPLVIEPIEVQNNIDLPVVVAQNNIDLPVVVAQNSIGLPMVVAQNSIDLPVVVAQSNIDLPVVVAQSNIGLPVVVAPPETETNDNLPIDVEADQAENEKEMWVINYGKDLQGLVISDQEIESHYYDIHTALLNTFLNNSYAILILEGYMMAIIKQVDTFYSFDSHARDSSGMPDPNGTAVVMRFANILDLEQYVYSLSLELHTNLYEIVPVQVNKPTGKTKCVRDQEYQKKRRSLENEGDNHARLQKASEYKKQKQLSENDQEKQIRLKKLSECKKRKQSQETESEKRIRLQNASEAKQRRRSLETESNRQIRL